MKKKNITNQFHCLSCYYFGGTTCDMCDKGGYGVINSHGKEPNEVVECQVYTPKASKDPLAHISSRWLRNMYVRKKHSKKIIAEMLDCSPQEVKFLLLNRDISR